MLAELYQNLPIKALKSESESEYKAFLTLLADGDLSYPTARISYV